MSAAAATALAKCGSISRAGLSPNGPEARFADPHEGSEAMSRSGYTDDYDEQWSLICWRGAVASAIRGKRGQAFLKEMLVALDSLPEKRLIAEKLEHNGDVCGIGAVGRARGINMDRLDPYDQDYLAQVFGIAPALAAEIFWVNDEMVFYERFYKRTPEERFERVRKWVEKQIRLNDQTPP